MIDEEDKTLLAKAETGQLGEMETRTLYTSLNELYDQAKKHKRSPGSSWSFSRIVAVGAAAVVGTVVCLAALADPAPKGPKVLTAAEERARAANPLNLAPLTAAEMRRGGRQSVGYFAPQTPAEIRAGVIPKIYLRPMPPVVPDPPVVIPEENRARARALLLANDAELRNNPPIITPEVREIMNSAPSYLPARTKTRVTPELLAFLRNNREEMRRRLG